MKWSKGIASQRDREREEARRAFFLKHRAKHTSITQGCLEQLYLF